MTAKNGGIFVLLRTNQPTHRLSLWKALAFVVLLLACYIGSKQAHAQDSQSKDNTIHGIVLNSVTQEPIARALVSDQGNRFATMTDSQGHFEFTVPPDKTGQSANSGPAGLITVGDDRIDLNTLTVRKPGFLTDPELGWQMDSAAKEISLSLMPEALIIGHVTLPSDEPADRIQVDIYQLEVYEGRAHWSYHGYATTRSNGEFRIAELSPGTYKLLTSELLDRNQLPVAPGGQLYGYPPVYFPNATDFAAADSIQLSAGQTFQADLGVVRQPYYPVKVPVTNVAPGTGINVNVSAQASHGPGYSLGYNQQTHSIEGLLPQGIYTLEVSAAGPPPSAGVLSLTVSGVSSGASMTMVPMQSIPIHVKEEFTSVEGSENAGFHVNRGNVRGPRRYLDVSLEPVDDYAQAKAVLRPPARRDDESLALGDVAPGRYWVHVESSRGYASSVTSGALDLQHEPLVVMNGASNLSIEITMRDDSAQIEGTIEGANPSLDAAIDPYATFLELTAQFAFVYCVPLPDSPGRFTEIFVSPGGTFTSPELPPGTYRVLAFKHPQKDLEYQNPEAMRVYDEKGQVVHLAAGQKENLTLQLTSKGR